MRHLAPTTSSPLRSGSIERWWLTALPVGAAAVVFAPVLRAPFVYDEFIQLYNLANFGLVELLTTPHGGHLLFASNLVYALLFPLVGVQPEWYYALALSTHLVNVALCQRVATHLTGDPAAAAIAATLWGCAALLLGSVGWFAVYGELLLTAITLWLLLDVARLAARGARPTAGTYIRWALLLVAACGSFGFGLLIAGVFAGVATRMLDTTAPLRHVLARIALSSTAVMLIYLGVDRLHAALSGRAALYGVASVAAVPAEPPLTEAATALWGWVNLVAYGIGNALAVSMASCEQGAIVVGPLDGRSVGTALTVVVVVTAAWVALLLRWAGTRTSVAVRQATAIGLVGLGCYAMIAAWVVLSGRTHSTVDALSGWTAWTIQITAARYHYLPTVLLVLASVRVVVPANAARARMRRLALVAGTLWATVAVAGGALAVRAAPGAWDTNAHVVRPLQRAVRSSSPGAAVYVANSPLPIPFARNDATLPGRAAIALLSFPRQLVDERMVFFVEEDPDMLRQIRSAAGTPIARFVVGPDEIPPGANDARPPRR